MLKLNKPTRQQRAARLRDAALIAAGIWGKRERAEAHWESHHDRDVLASRRSRSPLMRRNAPWMRYRIYSKREREVAEPEQPHFRAVLSPRRSRSPLTRRKAPCSRRHAAIARGAVACPMPVLPEVGRPEERHPTGAPSSEIPEDATHRSTSAPWDRGSLLVGRVIHSPPAKVTLIQ